MSLIRRYSAAAIAASVLFLGACGSEPAPTAPTPDAGEVGDNPLLISLSQNYMAFFSEEGEVPSPQTLQVSGLVAIGSYVLFQNTVFSPAIAPWLRMDPTPVFQREPLAWLFRFWIDPAIFASLEDGIYSANMDVVVPAALNSPQNLLVQLCKGFTCLAVGQSLQAALEDGDGLWDRYSIWDDEDGDLYFYDDYQLTLPPWSWTYVQMLGDGCGGAEEQGGNLEDPYLVAWYLGDQDDPEDYYTYNDDSDCLNSEILLENNSAMPRSFFIRATSYDEYDDDPEDHEGSGTYTIRSTQTPIPGGNFDGAPLRAEGTTHPAKAAKAGAR